MMADCQERDGIMRAYTAYLSDHLRCVQVLANRIGVMQREDYQSIRAGEERARKMAEQARLELEAHIANHGCAAQVMKSMTASSPLF